MTSAAQNLEHRKTWGRWALIWFIPLGIAARIIRPLPLAALVGAVAILGVLPLLPGRDRRERLVAILATIAMLAAGWTTLLLLPSGRASLAIIVTFVVIATAFGVWAKRRRLPWPSQASAGSKQSAASAATTPTERRAATELRWAQGAEQHRRQQADQMAEYERAAEQRRRQGAARRLTRGANGGATGSRATRRG